MLTLSKKWVLIFLFVALAEYRVLSQSGPDLPLSVSMLSLIASPERFEGKKISVIGYISFSREGDRLFPLQEYERNMILTDEIEIDRSETMGKLRHQLDSKYVQVVGTFRTQYRSLTRPRGVITDVEKCELWSDPKAPVTEKLSTLPGVKKEPN